MNLNIFKKNIADEIKSHASKFMNLDKFANLVLKTYFVRSIYFEDSFNSNFEEKINGYRIRKNLDLDITKKVWTKGLYF